MKRLTMEAKERKVGVTERNDRGVECRDDNRSCVIKIHAAEIIWFDLGDKTEWYTKGNSGKAKRNESKVYRNKPLFCGIRRHVANQITSVMTRRLCNEAVYIANLKPEIESNYQNLSVVEILLDSFHGLWSGDNEEAMQRGCVHCQP